MISQSENRLEQMRDNPNGVVMERELKKLKTWMLHHAGLFNGNDKTQTKFFKFLDQRIKARFQPPIRTIWTIAEKQSGARR